MAWLLLVTAAETASKQWADQSGRRFGPTRRFREFLLGFRPDPPSERPKECYRHKWDTSSLARSFKKIYEWRSNYVHEGIPFPAMMCTPPHEEDKRHSEIPVGLAMAVPGGLWKASDAPMQLHLFEHIVRGALLNWWKWNLPSVVYLNTATCADLGKIPGVGPKLANRIVAHRSGHGPLESFEELAEVSGIGEATARRIRSLATLVKK